MSATRQLFVNTGATAIADATVNDPSEVVDGKIAVIDREDLTAGTQDLGIANNDGEKFTIVRGGDNPQIENVNKDKIKAIRVQAYNAEVQQQTEITLDFTDVGDGEANVKFINVTEGFEPFPRLTASVVRDGENETTIAAALVEQINGSDPFVTATSTGAVITVTGEESVDGEPATSFQTAKGGILSKGASVASTQTPETAIGSPDQLINLEEFSWATRSYTMTNYFPQAPESHVVSGETYDLAVIDYENDNDHAVIPANDTRQIYVAFSTGTGAADLKAFFGF